MSSNHASLKSTLFRCCLCQRFNAVSNSRYFEVESTSILCRQIPRRSFDVALSTFYRRQKLLFRRWIDAHIASSNCTSLKSTLFRRRIVDVLTTSETDVVSMLNKTSILCRQISRRFTKTYRRCFDIALSTFSRRQEQTLFWRWIDVDITSSKLKSLYQELSTLVWQQRAQAKVSNEILDLNLHCSVHFNWLGSQLEFYSVKTFS